jgi:AraC-like DNA-binding protein
LWAALFYVLLDDNRISFVENNLFNSLQNVNNLSFAAKGQSYRLVIMKIVFIFQLILICIFSFKKLIRFDKQIKNYYANTEEKKLTPIKRLLIVFIIYAFLSVIANHVGRVFFLQEPWLVIIPSVIFSSMIFAIGYIGYKHILITDELYKEINYDIADKSIVMETTQTPYMSSQLGEAINQLMEEKEVFRQKGLLITDVAREIGSNRTYVSNYINKELNISFSEFINIYRIKFAQSLLTDTNQSYSMLEIIELSGFSHEGSFYRTFKKQTGLTPAQWREQQCSHIKSL